MKTQTRIITIALAFLVATALPLSAMEKGHDHSSQKAETKKSMDHGSDHDMDHSGHFGMLIKESMVKGYQLAYHLIDMAEKMEGMEDMPEMQVTHHLMLYVKAPHGEAVDNGMVGYMVKSPDGSWQKAMAMGMGGGYGADVTLLAKGTYLIKAKVVDGKAKLMDEFYYEVK